MTASKRRSIITGAVLAVANLAPIGHRAAAQRFNVVLGPPPETVIVTAPKWLGDHPQAVIHGFVNSYALAAPISNEITRWKSGICPATFGLSHEEYNAYVTSRIRVVGGEIGAPLGISDSCHTNIDVIFTDKPQEALDRIRAAGGASLLGPSASQAESEGTMRYAVQAWYSTGTRDSNGTLSTDSADGNVYANRAMDEPQYAVTGSLLRTDLRSELGHIYIIADTNKTQNYPLAAIADYVAVLALSQTQSFDACKNIPSITNLVSQNCDVDLKPTAITDTDMAYLKAVYSMDAGASVQQQENYISAEIDKSLGIK